jgi:5-bromo-4-chloroindolyl phosphate hydrolysis protein
MKKSNLLFIALTGASVVLISAIMADNSTSIPLMPANAIGSSAYDTSNTETIRQRFKKMGLPLHEGKYWKETHE